MFFKQKPKIMSKKKSTPAKTEKVIAPAAKTETAQPQSAPKPKGAAKELTPEQTIDALTPKAEINPDNPLEDEKPSATQAIPPVKQKKEDLGGEDKLNFEHMDTNRSMKFKIDVDNIGTPSHQTDIMREFFQKFLDKKEVKPNNMFINTTSLEKLGWRDVATDLGLHIKESTVYNDDEMVLALDI
jgi:hypothetical protein